MSETDPPVSTEDSSSGQEQIRTFLIADVRGYTLFTQERGDEAAAKLAAKFADIAREIVEARGGTLLELRGDEALCVFASTRQAIRAAIDLQQRFVEETLEQPELPLTVGIGLDAGEAVPVQGGYRGAALNLAARLCGQARAGEILATREVTHLARRIEGSRYEDRGSLTFKGISDPVGVVRVVPEGADPIERLRPFAPTPPAPPRTARRWVIPVAVAVALALVAISIPLFGSNGGSVAVGTNSIARMNAEEGSLELANELGQRPGASAIGFGSLWVLQPDRGRVARLDLEDGSITQTIPVGTSPAGIAVGEGSVWVTNAGDGTVSRIDPDSNVVSDTLERIGARPSGIAVGDEVLWVGDALGAELLRVELSGDTQSVPLAGQPSGVAFTPEGVWVSHAPDGVTRIDPADLSTFTKHVGNGPTAVLAAFDSIWVANRLDNTVSRIDPATGSEQEKVPVGEGPNALAAAAGSVWVANEFDSSITSIDPSTDSGESVPVGGSAASLAADGGDNLWLAVGVSAAEHRGGTLTVSTAAAMEDEDLTSLDPAVVVFNDFIGGQILSITNDGLLSFKKVAGPDGTTLVPDLASALPQVLNGGLTYRFPLREGITYSNGDTVQPEDFRHAVERTIALWADDEDDDLRWLYGAIVGANACRKDPSSCDLSEGIEAEPGAVTFHLAHEDPDLQLKLAMPWAFPVPEATPMEDQGLDALPATGPYMIAEAGADSIELVRNPEFDEWSGAAQPAGFVDTIAWRFEEEPGAAFDRLEAGELDWMIDPPPDELRSLQAADPDRVEVWPQAATLFIGFDVRTPPFDDERVRQALNYAIDRSLVLESRDPTRYRATCQILPPNLQGYEPFCPYTLEPNSGVWSAPDLDRAQTLIEKANATGERVTVWVTDDPDFFEPGAVEIMAYTVELLDELGLRADLKTLHVGEQYRDALVAGEAQAYLSGWGSAYPSAHDFIAPQFSCPPEGYFNISGLCSETLDAAIDKAQQDQATDPSAANSAWIEIEHGLVEEAIWVPLMNPLSTSAFSARTENIQVHPIWGVLQSRLWVQ